MRLLRYLAFLTILALPAATRANAQISVGIGIGDDGPPACAYGYYGYAPYACAPYGYYGPQWFQGGVFIGAGPWLPQAYAPAYGYGPVYRDGWRRQEGWRHGDDDWNRGGWGRGEGGGWGRGEGGGWGRGEEGNHWGRGGEGNGWGRGREGFHGGGGGGFHAAGGFHGGRR